MNDTIICVAMLLIYFGGLAYCVFSNPMPKANFEEYAVGGRSFGWQFITMTIIGTWYPGSLLIGTAQMGHDAGIIAFYLGFYTLGSLFFFFLISTKMWKLGSKYSLNTMGHYIQLRYKSKSLRVLSGAAALLCEFPWVITELLASGYAIQLITNGKIPFNMGMAIICVFFLLYIMFAGTRAVIIADYYQGWMFLLGALVLFVVAMFAFWGGPVELFSQVRHLDEELLTLPGPIESYWGGEHPGNLYWTSIILSGALGAYMWPSLFSRIFAAGSTKELKQSLRITPFVAPILTIIILVVAIGSATSGYGLDDTAYALVEMIGSLGPVPKGVVAIVILAGSLSMMDSMISSWSIVFCNDIVRPFKKDITDKAQLTISRIVAIVIAFAGLAIAMTDMPTIVTILTRIYQCIIQLFPLVVFGLYFKRGNTLAAWASLIVGFGITIALGLQWPDYVPALNGMSAGVFAFFVASAVYLIVAYVSKPQDNVEKLFKDMHTPDEELGKEELPF